MPLDRKRTALLHVAKKALGLSDEHYRQLLQSAAMVESSQDLDERGFESVMFYFKELGFESTSTRRHFGHRNGMATPRQIALIRHLWRDYTGQDDDRALNHWLQRTFGISALRFADDQHARKAIAALRSMAARSQRPDSGHDLVDAHAGDPPGGIQ